MISISLRISEKSCKLPLISGFTQNPKYENYISASILIKFAHKVRETFQVSRTYARPNYLSCKSFTFFLF